MQHLFSRLIATLGLFVLVFTFQLLPVFAQTTPAPTAPGIAPTTPPVTPPTTPDAPSDEPASTGATTQRAPFRSINPNPAVPIPGVTFSPAVERGGSVEVPFLAQYIAGIYRLSVGLGSILASIMIVYGGFRYLLAASLPEVKDGKTIIQDAFIGLVVLLSSYLILKTVNPVLIRPAVISVDRIDEQDPVTLAEQAMINATGPTTGPEVEEGAPTLTDCPFTDLPPGHIRCGRTPETPCPPGHCEALGRPRGCRDDSIERGVDARREAFIQRIQPRIASIQDPQQRLIQVAITAAHCNIHMGSCGSTAAHIRRIANAQARTDHAASNSNLIRATRVIRCAPPTDTDCTTPKPGCTSDNAEAVQRVRDMVRADQDARVRLLQPGDWIWIYNGNDQGCGSGFHSVIIVTVNGARARIVQGANGRFVREGTVCLLTSCPGGRFAPIIRMH